MLVRWVRTELPAAKTKEHGPPTLPLYLFVLLSRPISTAGARMFLDSSPFRFSTLRRPPPPPQTTGDLRDPHYSTFDDARTFGLRTLPGCFSDVHSVRIKVCCCWVGDTGYRDIIEYPQDIQDVDTLDPEPTRRNSGTAAGTRFLRHCGT